MNPRVCAGALPGPRGPCAGSRVSRGGLAHGSPSALRPGFRPGMHSAGVHPAPLRASRDPTRRRRHRGHRPPKPARVGRPAGGKLCWRLPLSQPLFSLWPSPRPPSAALPKGRKGRVGTQDAASSSSLVRGFGAGTTRPPARLPATESGRSSRRGWSSPSVETQCQLPRQRRIIRIAAGQLRKSSSDGGDGGETGA